jgi:ABC-type siderophore export system fused ATPase/permease subunit
MSERNRSNVILKAFRCFHLITPRDKKLLIGMASIQVFIGLLDLVGVAFLGVLGSLVINGVNNAPTNDLVIRILSILHIENLSFQNKAIFLAVFAVTVLLTRTLVSIMLTKSIYRILGRISARLTYQFSKNMLEHDLSKIETFRKQELIFSLTHGVQKITVEIIGQLVTMAADLASC